jgi:hypothetical protein
MAIMIMKQSISIAIRRAISDVKEDGTEKNAFEFMSRKILRAHLRLTQVLSS